MTLSIPESSKALIEQQASKAGYATPEEYLLSLVERDRHRALREEIEAKLVEALASPSAPMTREDWGDIERMGMRILAEGKGR